MRISDGRSDVCSSELKVKLQMLDQGAEVVLEGVRAEGLDAAMALQDFAGEHALARLAIDQGEGLETLWQPAPPTARFGEIAVEEIGRAAGRGRVCQSV